jgi:hypothetical protein
VRRLRALVLHAQMRESRTLSYQVGWPLHLAVHPRFECELVDVLDRRPLTRIRRRSAVRRGRFDLVVLLHSVYSNARTLVGRLFDEVGALPQPKAFFIGNEYKLMPEKMRFCEQLGIDLLVTMNHDPRAQALYRERLRCEVAAIPSAGLDIRLFTPRVPAAEREIDLGYRSYDAPLYVGHDERRRIAEWFVANGERLALELDVSLEPGDRFEPPGWAAFLNRCRGQLGTEAGGDWFELTDETRDAVNAYLKRRPDADWEEVRERFFAGRPPGISGRTISGRQVEAAGTKTVQILFEGEYAGYFEPDVHYIPLRKDFANAEEAVAKFRDRETSRRIAEAAYEVAVSELTYEKLIERFYDRASALV